MKKTIYKGERKSEEFERDIPYEGLRKKRDTSFLRWQPYSL